MFLLKKSLLDTELFNIVYMDSPGSSLSQTSLYQNVLESATILDSFEESYSKIVVDFENFGYKIEDYAHFESTTKSFYQSLRHGLSFDWVINHFVGEIVRHFPYCYFKKFSGTSKFLEEQKSDKVFSFEQNNVQANFDRMLDIIFVSGDTLVLRRLADDSKKADFLDAVTWAKEQNKLDDYPLAEETLYRTNYLVAIGMMLVNGVGLIKREFWHNTQKNMIEGKPEYSDFVLICGGKYKAFAFADFGSTKPKWQLLENGIRVIGNTNSDAVMPNHSTYFRLTKNTLELDYTLCPTVKIGNVEPYLDTNSFFNVDLPSGVNVLKIKYPFNSANFNMVELLAISGCAIKDQAVILDKEGFGETQIAITGNDVEFCVSHKNSPLPFAIFKNKEAQKSAIEWL